MKYLKKMRWMVLLLSIMIILTGCLILAFRDKYPEVWISDQIRTELGMATIKMTFISGSDYHSEIIFDSGITTIQGHYIKDASTESITLNPGEEESTIFKLKNGCLVSKQLDREVIFHKRWW